MFEVIEELDTAAALARAAERRKCADTAEAELRHRLPKLWARVMAGELQAWRARQVAEHTKTLAPEAAAWVDAQVAPFAHKIGLGRVLAAVQAALVRFDPEEAARREPAAARCRGVFVGDETTDGIRSIRIQADALDAAAFAATIDAIAGALGRLGDTDRTQVRRAKAVGVIADPQGTLDLLDHDTAGDNGVPEGSASDGDATTGVKAAMGAAPRRTTAAIATTTRRTPAATRGPVARSGVVGCGGGGGSRCSTCTCTPTRSTATARPGSRAAARCRRSR
jgi:hypothetical protein